jgi:fibronectin type 3 domain-containing protein
MRWTRSKFSPRRKSAHRLLKHTCLLAIEQLEARDVPSVNVLSYHNDNASTGQNLGETILTPANVNSSTFGKLFTTTVDGQVYAQPLIMTGVNITTGGSQGPHDVAFVETEHDSIYAIDANVGTVLWQDSFINPGAQVTTIPSADCNCNDISPEYGITGTPVIDPTTNTIYLAARTKEVISAVNHYIYRLHALSLSDGSEKFGGPAVIADTTLSGGQFGYVSGPSVRGTGVGGNKNTVPFNSLREAQRPGLTIANGSVYLAFGSECDNGPYHGWLLGYDLHTLQPTAVFNTTPNGTEGGIWMSGGAVTTDSIGNLFLQVGNGSFNASTTPGSFPADGDYGESILRIVPDPGSTPSNPNVNGWGLRVADFFTPFNEAILNQNDRDVGSGGLLLLPDSMGSTATPHLMVGGGKEGRLYLLNRDNLGKFDPNTDHVVQEMLLPDGIFETPALFGNSIYFAAAFHHGEPVTAYSITNAVLSATPSSQSHDLFFFPGSTTSISANGSTSGITWNIDRSSAQLRAYDATNLASELYTSAQAPGGRDLLGTAVKFAVPTVANGRVYVGTASALVVYGLLGSTTTPPQAPTNLAAQTASTTQINLSWVDPVGNNENGFQIQQSTDGVQFQQVGTANAGSTSFLVTGLQPSATYTYRVYAFNSAGNSPFSNTASATTFSQSSVLDFSNGFAGSTSSLTYNGSSRINGTNLELTDGGTNEAGSTFSTQAIDITHFTTSFTMQLSPGTNPKAAGITFTIQSEGATALGSSNGGLGYGLDPNSSGGPAIAPSVAVKFDVFNDAGQGTDSTGVYINGAPPGQVGSIDLSGTGVDLDSGDPFSVSLISDGSTLQVLITDTTTNQYVIQTYSINIPATIGSNTAFVGFTGSTSTSTAVQNITTWTYAATPNLPPFAPTNLAGVPTSGTAVSLSWTNNSSTETGFNIDRATDPGFTQNLVTLTAPASSGSTGSFADSNLISGTTYYYRIRAVNGFGNSFNSNVASVTPPTIPLTPSNAHATLITSTEIDFAWTDNSDNEDGFHIYRQTGSSGTFSLIATLPPNTTTYQDMGLTPSTQYDYHIQAFNVAGFADFAGLSVSTLSNGTVPASLVASGSIGQISLSWTGVSGATSYNVYRGSAAGSETLLATGVTSASYVDSGLSSGTTYFYKVTAIVSGVESGASNEASATTAPAAPTSPSAMAGNEQVTLTWTAPTGAQSYRIYRSTSSGGEGTTPVATGITTTSFTDAGLSDSLTYFYQISAVASGAEGPKSSEVSAIPFADHIQIAAPPNISTGTAFTITVSARDANNNQLLGYRGTVHFTSSDTGSGLVLPADYAFTSSDRGSHNFSVTLVTIGSQTITARDIVVPSTTGTAAVTVNPKSLPTFVLTVSTGVVAGTPFNLFVQAVDGSGNALPNYTGTIHFASSDPAPTLPADYTFQPSDAGRHTFMHLVLTKSPSQTLTVTDVANSSITKTSSVKVNPGAVTHFNIIAPSTVTAGTSFNITVVAADAFGNRVNNYLSKIHFTSSDTAATLPSDYAFTNADQGQHSFSVTLRTPGAQTVNVADKNNASLTGMANIQVNSATVIAPASALFDSTRAWDRSAIDALFAWDRGRFGGAT